MNILAPGAKMVPHKRLSRRLSDWFPAEASLPLAACEGPLIGGDVWPESLIRCPGEFSAKLRSEMHAMELWFASAIATDRLFLIFVHGKTAAALQVVHAFELLSSFITSPSAIVIERLV
jgi:hypothetical protein